MTGQKNQPDKAHVPPPEAILAVAAEVEAMSVPVPMDLVLMRNEPALIVYVLRDYAALKSRAEEHERTIALLESNARVQAGVLADTGRCVEELTRALRDINDNWSEQMLVRKIARRALAPSLDKGNTP